MHSVGYNKYMFIILHGHAMKHILKSASRELSRSLAIQEIPRILWKQEGSLPRSQEPAICPYPEPHKSSPWPPPKPIPLRSFLGAFTNCGKRLLVSSCLSVCPPVFLSACLSACLHKKTRLPQDGFSWNLIFERFFSKICREHSSFIEIRQGRRVLYMKTKIHF